MMKPPSEQELLRGALAGEMAALEAIYDRYSPGIYRYAVRLLGDESLAEDCVSETFARLLKALRAGAGPLEHLQAYLYRIAHNWITDRYRRQPLPPLDLDESIPSEAGARPDFQAEVRLEQQAVRQALRSLTPDQRQVVALRYLEGWENEQVAAALQKPVGTVRVLHHRAVQALRRLLQMAEREML